MQISVEPITHKLLIAIANVIGCRLGHAAGVLLDALAQSWDVDAIEALPDATSVQKDNLLVYWRWYEILQEERIRERIYKVAALTTIRPSEERRGHLVDMCDAIGMDFDAVLEQARADPFNAVVARGAGTKKSACQRWLVRLMTKRDGDVPVAVIRQLGGQRGFSKSTLNRAKTAINDDRDSPSIVSVREPEGWHWVVREHGQEEHQISIQ